MQLLLRFQLLVCFVSCIILEFLRITIFWDRYQEFAPLYFDSYLAYLSSFILAFLCRFFSFGIAAMLPAEILIVTCRNYWNIRTFRLTSLIFDMRIQDNVIIFWIYSFFFVEIFLVSDDCADSDIFSIIHFNKCVVRPSEFWFNHVGVSSVACITMSSRYSLDIQVSICYITFRFQLWK